MPEPCNVVLTTTNADFDSLAAACALASLWGHDERKSSVPTHVVLPRGALPVVQRFLAYHKHVLPLRGFKTIDGADIEALGVVDASSAARLGRSKQWLKVAETVHVYDHHMQGDSSKPREEDDLGAAATELVVEPVGSTTTLIVERLRSAGVRPSVPEATLYEAGQGKTEILSTALKDVRTETYRGVSIARVVCRTPDYVPGLAAVVEELLELTAADVMLMAAEHGNGVDLIGRARPSAVSVDLRDVMRRSTRAALARDMVPPELTAQVIMTKDVVTISANATVADAHGTMKASGLKSLPVVDGNDDLRGTLKLNDVIRAEKKGNAAQKVRGIMRTQVASVGPETTVGELETILVTTVGRVPVITDSGRLLGIVTRTDLVRLRNYDSTLPGPSASR
ncbi:phosphatase [Aureococcus anophagefferens]|nr:phosphatase [Aureococcus anophagefferens]